MPERLKVYGMRGSRGGSQARVIVAAQSWREAAKLAGISVHEATTYGSTTMNEREVEAAMARPRTVLWRNIDDHNAEFRP